MSALSCSVSHALLWLVNAYTLVLIIYAIISWIPDLRGPWVRYLAALVEPVLMPLRRIIPPMGGFDISFIVLLLFIQIVVVNLIGRLTLNVCYGI